jgi:hypothetical protein
LQLADLDEGAEQLSAEAYRLRREAAERRLSRSLFERYESLLRSGRRPVVVAIEGGSCSGCHLRLPTMVEHQARHAAAVHICPHCRRMLYAPALVDKRTAASKAKAP